MLKRSVRAAAILFAVLAVALGEDHVRGTSASAATEPRADLAPIKQLQARLLTERARVRMQRTREAVKKHGKNARVVRNRRPREETVTPAELEARQSRFRQRLEDYRTQAALVPNVRANDRTTDVAPSSTQSEESIAAWGRYVLVAWNDGEVAGATPPNNDVTGYAFSTDSGATFTDGGIPPKGFQWTWVSDPLVTVNEKTGTFYFCALADSVGGFSGVGIVSATFTGNSFNWGTPVMVRKVSPVLALDKPWVVADSTSDSLYVSYTTFTFTGFDHIQFQRSANGTNWSAATTLSAGADSGLVQGSRPVVGPLGEVYVLWYVIGPTTVDFFKIRKSTNAGSSFGTSVTIPTGGNPALGFYANWGTGAPGFNRERGISFPGVAVDRSNGPNRGRIYVTWNESINFYDDYQNTGPGDISEPAGESGVNDTPGGATQFTVNNEVRGAIGSATDLDYFRFNANQGQTGVFFLDSLATALDVSFRIFCSDGVTRLAFSNFGIGGGGLNVFTFPKTDTYYLRAAGFDATTGGYRIRTKFSVTGLERARDHRDVFVTSSANGTTGWSVPVRVNTDDAGHFDNWLPEIAVSGQGRLFVAWYDWRDSPVGQCGGVSHVYLARSDDGGGSWIPLGQVTDAQSDWTNSLSNLSPNQGDYIALYANENGVYPAWADVRNGDPDVYTAYIPFLVTPVQASLLSAVAEPRRVTLAWHAPGAEGLAATVYRRTESSDWAPLAVIDVPASARILYADDDVAPGARYGYRIGVVENGVEGFYGEGWVSVPRAALAISAIAPNPATRDLWVSFSLPGTAPATLSLIDVAGRSVRTRQVSAPAGEQRVNLGEGERLPMGVYVVKLTQGGRSVSARVSVVR